MFHFNSKIIRPIFVAATLGLLLLMLAACSGGAKVATAAASTSRNALANSLQASTQQASTSSVLSITVNPYPTQFTVYEVGQAMSTAVATGTDNLGPGDPITATIDWGDNTTPTQYTFIDGRTFQITGAHAYSKVGKYTITVTAAITIFQQSVSGTGVIRAVPDYTLVANNIHVKPGQAFRGIVATGTDPFPNDPLTGTINWGDNTTPTNVQVTSSSAGSYQVNAAHTYSQFGSFTITVSLTSFIVGPVTNTATAMVSTFTLTVRNLTVHAGKPFNGTVATLLGTVSAQGARVNIEWGDNTLVSKLMLSGGISSAKIKSGHYYSLAGTYTILVGIRDMGTGEQTVASGTVTVV